MTSLARFQADESPAVELLNALLEQMVAAAEQLEAHGYGELARKRFDAALARRADPKQPSLALPAPLQPTPSSPPATPAPAAEFTPLIEDLIRLANLLSALDHSRSEALRSHASFVRELVRRAARARS